MVQRRQRIRPWPRTKRDVSTWQSPSQEQGVTTPKGTTPKQKNKVDHQLGIRSRKEKGQKKAKTLQKRGQPLGFMAGGKLQRQGRGQHPLSTSQCHRQLWRAIWLATTDVEQLQGNRFGHYSKILAKFWL